VVAPNDANATGDALSGQAIIAGHHDDADASTMTHLDSFSDLWTWRIHHGN
jgi:hypothetical protein